MKKSTSIFLVVVLLAAAAGLYPLRLGLDCRRYSNEVVEELMYYPSGRLLKVADLGFGALAADIAWLRGIQYYGEHRRTDMRYPLAEHIFATITDLDPAFIGAYRFGALVLSEDVESPASAIDLLRKGIRANPDRWEIPFDLGFIYFVGLSDYDKAAHYFNLASRLRNSPDVARRFAAFAYRKAGRDDIAKALWEELYRSTSNSVVRETALYSIRKIQTDSTLQVLSRAVERFEIFSGHSPRSLADLVAAGVLEEIPREPFGGSYFLDAGTMAVSSTTLATEQAERAVRFLERSLKRYHGCKGCLPGSLAELKDEGLITEIPIVAGVRIAYDPVAGRVGYHVVWEDIEQ